MAIDRLINSTQGDSIIAALGSSGSIAQSLAVIAAKSNTPYNSDNKLNPSFIAYDTTHAAVTEAQRTQIGTNTTNIAWNTNNGVKNYLPINRGATTGAQYVFDWEAKDIPAGQYIISFTTTATSGAVAIEFGDSNAPSYNQTGYRVITLPAQSAEVTVGANTHYVRIYANVALTMSDIMLRPASISDSSYQPYALSNAELTDKERVNENNILLSEEMNGAKNLCKLKDSISSSNPSYTVTVQSDKSIVVNKTATTSSASSVDLTESITVDTSKQYVLVGNPNTVNDITLLIAYATTPFSWIGEQFNDTPLVFTPTSNTVKISIYFRATSSTKTVTIKPMLIEKAVYDAGFTDYQPYAMSNAELTQEVIPLTKGIKLVAHTSNNGNTSLSYDTNINDFDIGSNTDKNSGVYLIVCNNWSTTPAPYIGLLTFSGATTNHFVKTDVVTGFAPTISITENTANATIAISGAAKISIYAVR